MSNSLLMSAWKVARTLLVSVAVAPALAVAQSNDDQTLQAAAKIGVYQDVNANLLRMAATREEKASLSAAEARYDALLGRASQPVREWVRVEGQRRAHDDPSVSAIADAARERFGNDLSTMDIDQLIELVMAEVSKQADQELRDQLAQMRAHVQQKKSQRDAVRKMQQDQDVLRARTNSMFEANQPNSRAELAAFVTQTSDGKDSLDDLSEMDQMRLQSLMDRRQKALETLGDLMKKQTDASDSIIGNLK